jgi:hypothetical protein
MGFFTPFVYRRGFYNAPITSGCSLSSYLTVDGYDAVVWLNSDDNCSGSTVFIDNGITSATTGDDVYLWDDRTTYDNHAIQSVAGDRPTYITGGTCFNNKNIISFNDNQGDYMAIANDSSFNSLTELTIFLYFKSNDTFTSADVIVQSSDDFINGGQSDGWTVDYQTDLGVDYLRFVYDDDTISPSGYHELEIPYDYSSCNLVTIRLSGNTIDIWTGTTKVGTSTAGDGMDTPAGGFPLTIAGNYTGTQISPLDFGSFVLYNGPLSNSGITSVQNYLLSEYVAGCDTPTDGGTTTIGNEFSGTDSFLAPINGLQDFSWSATIYESSEIGSPRQITGLEYYISIGSDTSIFQNQTIKIGHVVEDRHDASPTIGLSELTITDLTTVYDGTYTVNGALWKGLTFDTNFCYNGVDNLIVIIENRDGFGSAFDNVDFVYNTESKYYTAYASNSGSFPTTVDARTFARPVIRFSH